MDYVCVEPAIGIRVLDNGIFAGHVVCPTVKAETATYSKALTVYICSQTKLIFVIPCD